MDLYILIDLGLSLCIGVLFGTNRALRRLVRQLNRKNDELVVCAEEMLLALGGPVRCKAVLPDEIVRANSAPELVQMLIARGVGASYQVEIEVDED